MQSQEQERLKYCNRCINKKVDARYGTLCGLTSQKPQFKETCKDFNQDRNSSYSKDYNQPKQQQPRYNKHKEKKSKSPLWIGGSILFTVIVIGLKIARSVSKLNNNNSKQSQYEYDYLKELEKAKNKRNKVPTINFLSERNRQASFNRKMDYDTVIVLNPKVKLVLPKGFRLSISDVDKELPIKATSRGYYFLFNKVVKDKKTSQLEQFKSLRSQFTDLYPGSELVIKKPLTVNTKSNDLDRVDFVIKYKNQSILGTGRLIDYKNERYFFQLISDAVNADHTKINRYLRYYVKVE